MKRPYYLYVADYKHNSGGKRVMHRLAHLLTEKGYKAYVNTNVKNPDWNYETVGSSSIDLDGVAIYPDRETGNPLQLKRYVRFLLHFPEHWGRELTDYNPETTFLFTQLLQKNGYENARILSVPVIERNVFSTFARKKKPTKTAYFVGKGDAGMAKLPKDCVEITSDYPATRDEVAKLLKDCSVIYLFDDYTLLINEALLCGCVPIIMKWGEFAKRDYERTDFGLNGLAVDESDLPRAIDTASGFKNLYTQYEKLSDSRLDEFIKITQAM